MGHSLIPVDAYGQPRETRWCPGETHVGEHGSPQTTPPRPLGAMKNSSEIREGP